MAIEGAPQILVGGAVNSGPVEGDYHVIVSEASIGTSKTGRPNLQLELTVKDDQDHVAKNGKKLTRMFQSLPQPGDDGEKVKDMQGFLKRIVYSGLGIKWPTEGKPLDPRIFVGKTAYARLAKKTPTDEFANIVAMAPTREALPVKKGIPTGPVAGNGAAKASRR